MILNLNRRILTSLIGLFLLVIFGINYAFYNASLTDYLGPSARQKFASIISSHDGVGDGVGVDTDDDYIESKGDRGYDWCSRVGGHRWVDELSSTWAVSCGEPISHINYANRNRKPMLSENISTSSLLCFQVQIEGDPDNFCVARNALYDPDPPQKPPVNPKDLFPEHGITAGAGKKTKKDKSKRSSSPANGLIAAREVMKPWQLSCSPNTEWDRGVQAPSKFRRYFSDTGVGVQLKTEWELNNKAPKVEKEEECTKSIMIVGLEGNGNIWHTLMEVWSGFLTMDVLRQAERARMKLFGKGKENERIWDEENVELYIEKNLDTEKKASPWFDMWTLVTGKEPKPIGELKKGCYKSVILPLAGGANPFWKDHWKERTCQRSTLVDEFVDKIFNAHGVEDSAVPTLEKVTVRFISRSHNRKIIHMEEYMRKLEKQFPNVRFEVAKLETMNITQQLEWAKQTDILVGVIGAGMTHTMFLREGAAVVELMHPEPFWYFGFGNLARARRLEYFAMHGDKSKGDVKDWQADDVLVPEAQFMETMTRAVEGQIERKNRMRR
ncbi:hypothetical protein H072_8092 [Dactylellina haptotyla CBS 200.50]|uniref:EGF domain-specific O-linked N-acetylglucosamine transferase n=1 Tax=Dactylellina haptotyla (strain CBS 200.50) TaxID=1284197 RepID=S8AB44_DACHA|nr:hypothetical protein H072_8092 [Dactylellina haptotyla CBS 200.50]